MPTPSATWQVLLGLFQEVCMPPLQANIDDLTSIFRAFEHETGTAVYSATAKLGDAATIRTCLMHDLARLCDQGKLFVNERGLFERVLPPPFEGRPVRSISTADMFVLNGPYLPLGAIGRRLARKDP